MLDYTQSSQVEFSYMLEGLENAWYSTQGDNQVTFRNIPHGNYVFKVKTRFRNQEWNENAAQLTVVIAPPLGLPGMPNWVMSYCLSSHYMHCSVFINVNWT